MQAIEKMLSRHFIVRIDDEEDRKTFKLPSGFNGWAVRNETNDFAVHSKNQIRLRFGMESFAVKFNLFNTAPIKSQLSVEGFYRTLNRKRKIRCYSHAVKRNDMYHFVDKQFDVIRNKNNLLDIAFKRREERAKAAEQKRITMEFTTPQAPFILPPDYVIVGNKLVEVIPGSGAKYEQYLEARRLPKELQSVGPKIKPQPYKKSKLRLELIEPNVRAVDITEESLMAEKGKEMEPLLKAVIKSEQSKLDEPFEYNIEEETVLMMTPLPTVHLEYVGESNSRDEDPLLSKAIKTEPETCFRGVNRIPINETAYIHPNHFPPLCYYKNYDVVVDHFKIKTEIKEEKMDTNYTEMVSEEDVVPIDNLDEYFN